MKKDRCGRCMFRANQPAPYVCNYFAITGHTRKAQPAEKCRFFREGKRIDPEHKGAVNLQEIVRSAGEKEKKGGKRKKYDWDQARELYDRGLSDGEIGRKIGCSSCTVCSWRKRNSLPVNPAPGRAGQGRAGQGRAGQGRAGGGGTCRKGLEHEKGNKGAYPKNAA